MQQDPDYEDHDNPQKSKDQRIGKPALAPVGQSETEADDAALGGCCLLLLSCVHSLRFFLKRFARGVVFRFTNITHETAGCPILLASWREDGPRTNCPWGE